MSSVTIVAQRRNSAARLFASAEIALLNEAAIAAEKLKIMYNS